MVSNPNLLPSVGFQKNHTAAETTRADNMTMLRALVQLSALLLPISRYL